MASTDAIARRLRKAGYVVAEPDALDILAGIADEFGLTAAAVVEDFDIMNDLKENKSIDVCVANVSSKAFKDFITKQHAPSSAKPAPHHHANARLPFGSAWENMSDREALLLQPTPKRQAVAGTTPGPARQAGPVPALRTPLSRTPLSAVQRHEGGAPDSEPRAAALTPSASTVKFAARHNRGELVCTLNDHLPEWQTFGPPRSAPPALELLSAALPPVGQHLFMHESLSDKVHAVDERLQEWGELVQAAIPEAAEARSQSVAEITQDPVWSVGRVVVEWTGEDGPGARLSVVNAALEGLRSASDGARVRLDTSCIASAATAKGPLRLFPGQCVAVHGVNPTGRALVAHAVCAALPAPLAAPATGAACVIVATGPYTTSDCLAFTPLTQLLQHVEARQPDVLLLLGPFVDAGHPLVKAGLLGCTFDAIFQEEVVAPLTAWQGQHPGVAVVMVPSAQDAHHAPVFPTPPFALPAAGAGAPRVAHSAGLLSMPNPCMLRLPGGLTVGACAVDVLKALSGCELAVGPQAPDRLASLAAQTIGQRSFFPVLPAPLGTCLDTTASATLAMHTTPHVLLLPSDLTPFAKLLQVECSGGLGVEQVVCVNPGRLMRAAVGGTFAVISAQPGEGSTASMCRVEVRRV